MRRSLLFAALFWLPFCAPLAAQQPGVVPVPPASPFTLTPIFVPPLSPGVLQLLELESRFSDAVAAGGGKAFASFFADDAVTLNNGKPAVLGRGAIAQQANWDPKLYQLSWIAQGAQMGPSNDMGFTWGQYVGKAKNPDGSPSITTGRYITIWRKIADGNWKVAMDASANDVPAPAN